MKTRKELLLELWDVIGDVNVASVALHEANTRRVEIELDLENHNYMGVIDKDE